MTVTKENNQYLTFKLDKETFALEINQVREVLDYTHITNVPRTPDFLCGVLNLRGNVVPVIDLRLSLGMSPSTQSDDTCIVIVEVDIEGDRLQMGALADSVQEVVEINPGEIGPAPKLGIKLNTEFIKGMGRSGDNFIIILDINQVLSEKQLETVESSADIKLNELPEQTN